MSEASQKDTPLTAFERLCRWRDVGDGPVTYCAGNPSFADDVRAVLAERTDLLAALTRIYDLCTVHASPDAFKNGVTDATNTIDEGEVWASGIFDECRAAIARAEGR